MLVLYPPGIIIDLLEHVAIADLPQGVTISKPYCWVNGTDEEAEVERAYHLDETAQLTVQTAVAFPDGFPTDFSLLLVVKTVKGKEICFVKYISFLVIFPLKSIFPLYITNVIFIVKIRRCPNPTVEGRGREHIFFL